MCSSDLARSLLRNASCQRALGGDEMKIDSCYKGECGGQLTDKPSDGQRTQISRSSGRLSVFRGELRWQCLKHHTLRTGGTVRNPLKKRPLDSGQRSTRQTTISPIPKSWEGESILPGRMYM